MTPSGLLADELEHSDSAGYAWLPGLRFAANAIVALPGWTLEHAVLSAPLPLDQGFEFIHDHLGESGRPLDTVAGIELQMPASLSLDDFRDFNTRYLSWLENWNLLRDDGSSRLARTNVAPSTASISEASIVAFTYTVRGSSMAADYIVSGVAEVPDGGTYPDDIVRRGESSIDALTDKATCVVDQVRARIAALGLSWRPGDAVHLYSTHNLALPLRDVLDRLGIHPIWGITWHDASPPALELTLEVDVRRFSGEHRLEH